MKCQSYYKMEAFEKGLRVGFEVYNEWGKALRDNGFEEEFLNNLLAQICFFLLTRTEYQKNNIITEHQVSVFFIFVKY